MTDLYNSIFIFSNKQLDELKSVNEKMGIKYNPKYVIINGVKKEYTSIVPSLDSIIYTDYKVIYNGDIRNIKYTT